MILTELYDQAVPNYQDLSDDDGSDKKLHDMRKTKLTLRQINKIRRMNDMRTFEKKQKLAKLRKQYSQPPAEGSMPGL
jgi:hypothetical protein